MNKTQNFQKKDLFVHINRIKECLYEKIVMKYMFFNLKNK